VFEEKIMKKIILVPALFFSFMLACVSAQSGRAIDAITNHYASGRGFTSGAVNKADLDAVIQAGLRAPSARNRQPWHFTVVQSQALAKRIIGDIDDGNVIIIVSAAGDGKTNGDVILDCGLAVESIYLAAQALGLGSRIYTGPIDAINKSLKAELGLPNGYSAVALVRIGKIQPGTDALSAASNRKAASGLVNYK
jgi:nitroreductase